MVLQDVSDPTPSFPDSSTPSSSPDTYDTSSTPSYATPFPFDPSQYPRPLRPFFRSREDYNLAIIQYAIKSWGSAAQILGREPTTPEISALLHHNLKCLTLLSYGPYLGGAAGALRYYSTFAAHPGVGKLPFMKAAADASVFTVFGVPVARGPLATAAHIGLRGSLYVNLGVLSGMLFMTSYGMTVAAVGIARDPELNEYRAALQQRQKKAGEELKRQMLERPLEGAKRTPQQRGGRRGGAVDDASPTGGVGVGVDEGVYAGDAASMRWEGAGSDTDDGQAAHSSTSPATRSWQPREQPQSPSPSHQQQPQDSPSSGSITDDFVSPSPNSSSYYGDESSPSPSPSQQSSSGSSWDRLRREAASSPSSNRRGIGGPRPQRPAPDRSSAQAGQDGESFSFSSREEEKQLAKEQAQKEFDRMVERERRGDETGKGGWRR